MVFVAASLLLGLLPSAMGLVFNTPTGVAEDGTFLASWTPAAGDPTFALFLKGPITIDVATGVNPANGNISVTLGAVPPGTYALEANTGDDIETILATSSTFALGAPGTGGAAAAAGAGAAAAGAGAAAAGAGNAAAAGGAATGAATGAAAGTGAAAAAGGQALNGKKGKGGAAAKAGAAAAAAKAAAAKAAAAKAAAAKAAAAKAAAAKKGGKKAGKRPRSGLSRAVFGDEELA